MFFEIIILPNVRLAKESISTEKRVLAYEYFLNGSLRRMLVCMYGLPSAPISALRLAP